MLTAVGELALPLNHPLGIFSCRDRPARRLDLCDGFRWQGGLQTIDPLPQGERLGAVVGWHVMRRLDSLMFVDVASTISKRLGHLDPYDQFGPRVPTEQGILIGGGGETLYPDSSGRLEVYEQQTDLAGVQQVAFAEMHPVSVVGGEGEGRRAKDRHDPDAPALVGHRWHPGVVDCGQVEEVAALDELHMRVVEFILDDRLFETIC